MLVNKVFYTQWGSSMTLYDFYLVTGETTKGVKLRKLSKEYQKGGNMFKMPVRPLAFNGNWQLDPKEKEIKGQKVFDNNGNFSGLQFGSGHGKRYLYLYRNFEWCDECHAD